MMKKFVVVLMLLMFMLTTGALAALPTSDPNLQQQSNIAPGTNNSNYALQGAVNSLSSYYSSYFINNWANKGATWLNNTSFSLFAGNNWNSLNYQVNTVQPIGTSDWLQAKSLGFWQANVQGDGSSVSGNIGIGYRRLSDSKNALMGANLFYDIGSLNNNYNSGAYTYKSASSSITQQRVGVGIEYLQSYFEGHANYYLPVTSRQNLGSDDQSNYYQEALSGYDVTVASAIPGAQWLKANVRGYQYFGNNTSQIVGSNSFMNGFDLSASAQITPQLALSGGYDTGSSSSYAKFSFNLLAMPVPALFLGDNTIDNYANLNLSNKMLDQVSRNNTITVANEAQAKYTGSYVPFKINVLSWADSFIVGAPVTLVNAAGTYSYTANTQADGSVTFMIPQELAPTAAVGGTVGINSIWNIIVSVQEAVGQIQSGGAVEYYWRQVLLAQTLTVNSVLGPVQPDGVTPLPQITLYTQPQPSAAEIKKNPHIAPAEVEVTKPGGATEPAGPTIYPTATCLVHVVDDSGAPVALAGKDDQERKENIKIILLSPSKASSAMNNLPVATPTIIDAAKGLFTFQPALADAADAVNDPISGAYGVTVKGVGANPVTAYGNTINMPAYFTRDGQSIDVYVTVRNFSAPRDVNITVRDYMGNMIAPTKMIKDQFGAYQLCSAAVRVGSSINVIDPLNYGPQAQPTVNGVARFTGITIDPGMNPYLDPPPVVTNYSNFYVLAYYTNQSQDNPVREIIATGQWSGLLAQFPGTGPISLPVQQLPPQP
ncbi:MAG: inverse autotransporter beta domain-containing protein [Bacillota bacterium]